MQTETITVISVTTETDDYGNSATTQTEQDVPGVMFEPMQSTERTDPHSPGVVSPAKFYLPVAIELNADDVILRGDGSAWEVKGRSSVWGDRTEVPVTQAGAV